MKWDQHLELGKRLCEAWDLDPQTVRSISIDISVDGMTVLVEMIPPGMEVALSEFTKYHLVLNEEHRT